MAGESKDMQGAATDVAGLSQVDPLRVSPPDGASIPSADDALNTRLKSAGMYTIPEMMGVTPLTRWTVHAGMTDLDFFQAWLDRRLREFLRMKAGYELRDRDKGDELYEWVLAHSAALSEVRDNFLAARAAMAAPCDGSGLTEGDSAAREAGAPDSTPTLKREGQS